MNVAQNKFWLTSPSLFPLSKGHLVFYPSQAYRQGAIATMSMNLNITLPLNVIQKVQSAPNEAAGDFEITKACATAALSAVKQLPYKLQPQDATPTPKAVLAATSAASKRPRSSNNKTSSLTFTIVSTWLGPGFAGYEFRGHPSTNMESLRDFMESKGVSFSKLRYIRNGRSIPDYGTLESVSSQPTRASA